VAHLNMVPTRKGGTTPGGMQCSKSTSVNVTWTILSYLLSFKLPSCMICSNLPWLTSICSCALYFHTIILCTHLGGILVCIMIVSWACDPPYLFTHVVSSWIMVHTAFSLVFNISLWAMIAKTYYIFFRDPFVLDTFWRFHSKGGELGAKSS
jgi:hypothetical protein